MAVAEEAGCTPSQPAINYVRQKAPHIIPILGARRLAQVEDNLGMLDCALSAEQIKRLDLASPLPAIYPHSFWNDFVRKDLIFGEREGLLTANRPVFPEPWF